MRGVLTPGVEYTCFLKMLIENLFLHRYQYAIVIQFAVPTMWSHHKKQKKNRDYHCDFHRNVLVNPRFPMIARFHLNN